VIFNFSSSTSISAVKQIGAVGLASGAGHFAADGP